MKEKILIVLLLGLILTSFTGCLSTVLPEPNNPPAITSSPIETATVEEEYVYNVLTTDSDGDTLTYFLTTDPFTDMAINENSGVIIWIPTATGSYNVTVEVSDGELSNTQNFTIEVSVPEPINQSPLITSIPVTAVTIGETYTCTIEATDPDGDTLTYSFAACPVGMTIDSTTGTISWAPTATGSYDITVEVSDGELSNTQNFTIEVSVPEPINQSPFITSIPVTAVTLGETYTCTIEATDPDGDTLTYSFAACPVGMTIDSTTGTITWIPTALGSYYMNVEVSDGELSDVRTFAIIVSPVPIGPTIVSLSPLEAVVGELYTGQVTTTPGSNATLAYSLIGDPDGMTINSITGLINWIPAADGEQAVTVIVTNGIGLSDSKDYNIVVSPANQAPVITTIPDATIALGETFAYPVEAADPDGDDLTYSLTNKPTGMTIDPTTGVITWIPIATGSYDVTVEVSDGDLSDTQIFTIVVVPNSKRVVMLELFEGPECGRCKVMHSDIVRLRQEYNLDELVILEEYGWDTSTYTGWGINDVKSRYYGYLHYLGIDGHFPDAYFNGINQTVHYDDSSYNNYKSAIEAELAKPVKIYITANYSISGRIVSINGNIANISSSTLNNLVVEAMIYENSVYSEYREYNVDHVVRDIITNEESGESIISFSHGENHQFSLTSSYLSNVHNMNNIHVVVYVQAPNSSTKEILQALYVE
jgi:predicted RNA-binding protein with TRAM domain